MGEKTALIPAQYAENISQYPSDIRPSVEKTGEDGKVLAASANEYEIDGDQIKFKKAGDYILKVGEYMEDNIVMEFKYTVKPFGFPIVFWGGVFFAIFAAVMLLIVLVKVFAGRQ